MPCGERALSKDITHHVCPPWALTTESDAIRGMARATKRFMLCVTSNERLEERGWRAFEGI